MNDQRPPAPTQATLDFWFGDLNELGEADAPHRAAWFKKDQNFDEEIASRFRGTYTELLSHGLNHPEWVRTADDRMAALLVLDQFSRNMFRDQRAMFAADPLARHYAFEMIALAEDRAQPFAARVFVYMPLMHSEELSHQERCIELFSQFSSELTGSRKQQIEANLGYAHRHRDIIARFGRFPHRNAILGRTSTAEELSFLSEPGSSF